MPPLKNVRSQDEQGEHDASRTVIIDATHPFDQSPFPEKKATQLPAAEPAPPASTVRSTDQADDAMLSLIPTAAQPRAQPSPTPVGESAMDMHLAEVQVEDVNPNVEFIPVAKPQAHGKKNEKGMKKASTKGKRIMGSSDLAHDVEQLALVEHDEDLNRLLRPARRIPPSKDDTAAVPREILMDMIHDRIEKKQECMMIPFIVAYFVVFAFCLLVQERTKDLSQVEREFRGMLEGTTFEGVTGPTGQAFGNPVPVSGHKTLDDIDVIQDVYTYMQDALLPLFIQNGAKLLDKNRVLSYNQLIGGVTFQQTRKQKRSCAEGLPDKVSPPTWLSSNNPLLDNFDCFPVDTIDAECYGPGPPWREGFCPGSKKAQAAPFVNRSRRLQEVEEAPLFSGWFGAATNTIVDAFNSVSEHFASDLVVRKNGRRLSPSAHAAKSRMGKKAKKALRGEGKEDMFSITFNPHEGLEVAWQKLAELKANNWMDRQTSWVGVRIIVLNPDLAVFCSAIVNIFFAPSGELVPYLVANSFLMSPFQYQQVYILNGLFVLLWLHLGFMCIVSLIKAIKANRCKAYIFSPRNLLEWFSFFGGAGVLFLCFQYVTNLNALKDKAVNLVLAKPEGDNPSFDVLTRYFDKRDDTVLSMIEFDAFVEFFRVYISWYTMFIMLRFLRAFEAQPKLSVVTQTITQSFYDLVHFGIVFFLVIISFTISAMVLFGHRLVEYASYDQAIMQTSQIFIGNFDFQELAEENLTTTTIWFVAFISTLTMVMLNMILAIIMDVYSEAKAKAETSDSIKQQLDDIKQDAFNRELVPKQEVLKIIHDLPSPEFDDITKERLKKACPSMGEKQASDLIAMVDAEEKNDDDQNLSYSDATRLVMVIKNQTKFIEHQIHLIRSEQQKGKDFEAEQQRIAEELGQYADTGKPAVFLLDKAAEKRIRSLEARLDALEEFLNEAMSYMVFRGKELKNRLRAIEEFLRGRRDANELGDVTLRGYGDGMGNQIKWSPPAGSAASSTAVTPRLTA